MLLNGVSYLYTILMVSLRLPHKLLNSKVKEYNDCAKAIIFFLIRRRFSNFNQE